MGKLIFFAAVMIVFLMGIVFLTISYVIGAKNKKKIERCTCKTVGRVVTMRRITNRDNYSTPTTSWFPVYEYYVGEQRLEKQSSYGQDKQIFYDGQKVEVFYNPSDWNEFYVQEENINKIRLIMGVVGGILFVCSILTVLVYILLFY